MASYVPRPTMSVQFYEGILQTWDIIVGRIRIKLKIGVMYARVVGISS